MRTCQDPSLVVLSFVGLPLTPAFDPPLRKAMSALLPEKQGLSFLQPSPSPFPPPSPHPPQVLSSPPPPWPPPPPPMPPPSPPPLPMLLPLPPLLSSRTLNPEAAHRSTEGY
mmetsp:Transcript_28925/g.48024  ORF Transcript_28925/g.48024 Transcript_28925/m.48024 type:complete len:112 (-) Transcript_28925:105-440(-)